MALPQLNDVPNYDLVIPSTQQKITYRPFLVKEQKVLLMALETQDQAQVLRAITNTIQACVIDKINIENLATYDVEYLFTQIRSKSVGETTTVNMICQSCEGQTEVSINLGDIKIDDVHAIDNKVVLNDQFTLQLRPPQYKAMLSDKILNANSATETLYSAVVMSLDSLLTEDEKILFDDESPEDVENFLENLTQTQFQSIMDYVNQLPSLKHNVDYACEHCHHENKVVLQGIQDFF